MNKLAFFSIFFIILFLKVGIVNAAVSANAKVDVTELFLDANTGLIGFKITNITDTSENWTNCSGGLVHYHRRADNQPLEESISKIITSTIYTTIATNKRLWVEVGYEGTNICFISKMSLIK